MIATIRKYDFEARPISTSPEEPGFSGIDIISPHWYETENIWESDLRTALYIDKYKEYDKPVVFGEQGNATFNCDEASAVRMRIRLWTAFLRKGFLYFGMILLVKVFNRDCHFLQIFI